MCVGVYADLIASMTLHLMRNTDRGDVRVRNELSRKLDISPHGDMTRHAWMSLIVWTLMMHGNQVTVPRFAGGYLEDLTPVPPSQVSFVPDGGSYRIMVSGAAFRPNEALHFMVRPDPEAPYRGMGYGVSLADVVRSIRQTNATKDAIMRSPAPSIIVKVDGLSDEFSSPSGRAKLRAEYIDSSDNGQPWFIPAEAFSVEQVKPLTLNDLAIKTGLELDKRAVASIMGVPPFLVGVGDFKKEEFNWFVTTRVLSVAKSIEQELTRKLLFSPDLYWRFNNRSLLSYDIGELVTAGSEMVDRMALRRNEWRDWIGLPPGRGYGRAAGAGKLHPGGPAGRSGEADGRRWRGCGVRDRRAACRRRSGRRNERTGGISRAISPCSAATTSCSTGRARALTRTLLTESWAEMYAR